MNPDEVCHLDVWPPSLIWAYSVPGPWIIVSRSPQLTCMKISDLKLCDFPLPRDGRFICWRYVFRVKRFRKGRRQRHKRVGRHARLGSFLDTDTNSSTTYPSNSPTPVVSTCPSTSSFHSHSSYLFLCFAIRYIKPPTLPFFLRTLRTLHLITCCTQSWRL